MAQRQHSNRETALTALLTARSVSEAARESGLSERTFYRYLADAEFKKAYRDARRESVETAIASIQSATAEAVECLIRNLHCEQPAVEVRAAQILIDASIRGVEIVDFQERLERLEGMTNANT